MMTRQTVQRMYLYTEKNKYMSIIWSLFLTSLLTAGCMLACLNSWGVDALPQVGHMFVTAAIGILLSMAAVLLRSRSRLFFLLWILPWPVILFGFGISSCVRGFLDWLNVIITSWNTLHEGAVPLFGVTQNAADIRAFSVLFALLIGEIAFAVVRGRHSGISAVLAAFWTFVMLLGDGFDAYACAFMLSALTAIGLSGKGLCPTRRSVIWTFCVMFCLLLLTIPQKNLAIAQKVHDDVADGIYTLRYGETVLPEGDLRKAGMLHGDMSDMLEVSSVQSKNIYLKGYVGSEYTDGVWKQFSDADFSGTYDGMLGWLSDQDFDVQTQVAQYYSLSSEDQLSVNYIRIGVTGANRALAYVPASLNEVTDGHLSTLKDGSMRSRGLLGAKSYEVTEISGSRPSELTVAEDWVNAPDTDARTAYLSAEAVYRSFVYDKYLQIDSRTLTLMNQIFWNEDRDDAGIYSAVTRIRSVLSSRVSYAENPEDVPESDDPLEYFLARSKEGNACMYASAAVMALRAAGIPARYVEGYYVAADDLDGSEVGTVSLTGENAHAWTEIYFDGIGWLPVDVTPGYYYDAGVLKDMVDTPDTIHRTAAIENDQNKAQQVSPNDDGAGDNHQPVMYAVREATLVILGVGGIILILLAVILFLLEAWRLVVFIYSRWVYVKADERKRILITSYWIFFILRFWGFDANLGWHVDETDVQVSKRFKRIEPGDYRRVTDLFEKVIYGDMELEVYEKRTVNEFMWKVFDGKYARGLKGKLRWRYAVVLYPLFKRRLNFY